MIFDTLRTWAEVDLDAVEKNFLARILAYFL